MGELRGLLTNLDVPQRQGAVAKIQDFWTNGDAA